MPHSVIVSVCALASYAIRARCDLLIMDVQLGVSYQPGCS